mgnify:CR=1 FL=1
MEVTGEVWHWRGPAPFHFVTVPGPQAEEIAAIARDVTYGWGMVPVGLRLGINRTWDSRWRSAPSGPGVAE